MIAPDSHSAHALAPDTEWPPLKPFWQAAKSGELRLPQCEKCGTFNWYPSSECRACGRDSFTWVSLSGKGSLFAWVVVRRALHPDFANFEPYVVGIVTLAEDESVRMVSRLLVDADAPLAFGMPMNATFVDLGHPISRTGITGVLWKSHEEEP
jgi:uncharacterized OB-fold protein